MDFLRALVVGAAGGVVFWYVGAPLPWMLGAMTATGAGALLRWPIAASMKARAPMVAIMGAMLGTSFSQDMLGQQGHWLVPLAMLVPYIAVAGTVGFHYLRRVTGMDRRTAFYSAMPGGLVDLLLMGERDGADTTAIALMHAARIFLVVLFLPNLLQVFVAADISGRGAAYLPLTSLDAPALFWFGLCAAGGGLIGTRLRLPAPLLVGPMLASAGLHLAGLTDFEVPTLIVAAAQVVLGASIGCRFAGTPPAAILRTLRVSLGATALLLAVTAGFAGTVAGLTGLPFAETLLAADWRR
jgi:membrane AbrB-like protein